MSKWLRKDVWTIEKESFRRKLLKKSSIDKKDVGQIQLVRYFLSFCSKRSEVWNFWEKYCHRRQKTEERGLKRKKNMKKPGSTIKTVEIICFKWWNSSNESVAKRKKIFLDKTSRGSNSTRYKMSICFDEQNRTNRNKIKRTLKILAPKTKKPAKMSKNILL